MCPAPTFLVVLPIFRKNRLMRIFLWILRIVPAVILLQTLFFKFTGAPESIYIFETLGVEPTGRYAAGVAELVVAILLLIPRTTLLGALGGIGIMSGAVMAHLGPLGVDVQGDGGLLFALACVVLFCCALLFFLHRRQLAGLFRR